MVALIAPTRTYLDRSFKQAFQKGKIMAGMNLLEDQVDVTVLEQAAPNPQQLGSGESLLKRIRDRGIIRVGFREGHLPFSFFNSHDELVGFDVDMAHRLAGDLGVEIEFVPIDMEDLAHHLELDHCDIVMTGVAESIARAEQMPLSVSYLDTTLALVVRDHLDRDFTSLEFHSEVVS